MDNKSVNSKNIRHGFTMIELLSVIIILSLVISLVLYMTRDVYEDIVSKLDTTTKNIILDATSEYVLEYRNNGGWKEYLTSDGNITFCVSLNSLLESGYYDYDDRDVIENKDKLFVKGVIDSKKVFSYDLIGKEEDVDNYCHYTSSQSSVNNNSNIIDILDDDDNESIGSLKYEIIDDDETDNKYPINIDFVAELGIENIVVDAPVYVAIVLDNSGSMSEVSWNNARNAAINLSETIINQLDDSYVALIQYNDNPMLVRNFKNEVLTKNMFVGQNGGTNVSGSLDLVSSLYRELDIPDYSLLYTILLYDGAPNYYSYLKDINNNSSVYNSSIQLYYDNFLTSFNGSNNNYNYYYGNTSGYNYVINAANYLKSENINSKLITIGYNFSNGNSQLKKISTNDNDFCYNSDFFENVEKESEENLLNEDIVLQSITYPFVYNESNGSLVSSNVGVRTESYGYFELDLTDYSISDQIELEFDYAFSSLSGYYSAQAFDYFRIYVGDSIKRDMSKFSDPSCSASTEENTWLDVDGGYVFCDVSTDVTKKIVLGGKKYYIHFYYEQNSGYDKVVTINNVSYSVSSSELIYDSELFGYNYDGLVNLSTVEESRLVYDSIIDNNKLGLSGQAVNSYSGSYKKIDLTGKEGIYLLTVNARSNNGMGVISVSDSNVSLYPPAKSQQVSGVGSFAYESYRASVCNSPNFRCIFASTSDTDFNFKLDGGKVYYVHFVNTANELIMDEANLIINSVSLNKINDDVINIDIDSLSSDSCLDGSIGYVSCLKNSNDYEFSFVANNGSIISSNKEVSNTCSYSYVELDLTSYVDEVLVSFNSTISSEGNKDYGNIIITDTLDVPSMFNGTSCDLNSGNNCVLVTSGTSSNEGYVELEGGKKYYVHFMYCKNSSGNSGGDYFSINKINISMIDGNTDGILDLDDTVDYNNYSFMEMDNALISTNEGVGNSISHSYLKIDLSLYDDSERFLFQIDDFASHNDLGMIIMTSSSDMPSYYDYPLYSADNTVISINNGDDSGITTNDIIVNGGLIYYVHFIYQKGNFGDYYDDYYKIDGVRIYRFDSDDVRDVDLSLDKYSLENYGYVLDNGRYVSTSDKIYTSNYSYFEVDLSNYSRDDEFLLKFNITLEDDIGINKINITANKDIPAFYNNSATLFMYSGTKDYSTSLVGGKKYYVHILNTNTSELNSVSINSISLNRVYVESTEYYCYYNSDEEKIDNVFSNLSTKVIDSVPKLTANSAKIILTTKFDDEVSFHIEDNKGNISDVIEKEIILDQSGYTEYKENASYVFVLDDIDECKEEDGVCEVSLKLFNITIELNYDDDQNKVISLDESKIPFVTIEYRNEQAIN